MAKILNGKIIRDEFATQLKKKILRLKNRPTLAVIQIGNNVIFAQNIVASALNHEYKDVLIPIHEQKIITKPIVIQDDCWIAANAVITAGVTIGKHSVVAAGAVVTKNVLPYSVVVGNPAKMIKQYDFDEKIWKTV